MNGNRPLRRGLSTQQTPGYNQISREDPHKKPSKKLFWVLGILFVIVIAIFLILFLSNKPLVVTQRGESLNLGETNNVNVKIKDTEHNIQVESVGEDYVDIVIQSDPIKLRLKTGETKELDLDHDRILDFRITLVEIENRSAKFLIYEITRTFCNENWICTDWGNCIEGIQTRTCDDSNNCGILGNKPETGQECVVEEPENETEVNLNETIETVNETIKTTPTENLVRVECENWGCFIDASEDCSLANFTYKRSSNLPLNLTTTTYYEFKGFKENIIYSRDKCLFYIRAEELQVEYTEEYMQEVMSNTGFTREEVEQLEVDFNLQADALEGNDGSCNLDTPDLSSNLIKLRDGNEIVIQWEFIGDCQGKYFE